MCKIYSVFVRSSIAIFFLIFFFTRIFLVACTLLCRSIRRSVVPPVGPLVRPSVCPSVRRSFILHFFPNFCTFFFIPTVPTRNSVITSNSTPAPTRAQLGIYVQGLLLFCLSISCSLSLSFFFLSLFLLNCRLSSSNRYNKYFRHLLHWPIILDKETSSTQVHHQNNWFKLFYAHIHPRLIPFLHPYAPSFTFTISTYQNLDLPSLFTFLLLLYKIGSISV